MRRDQCVYIVDDDEAVRDSLSLLLESKGYAIKSFVSAPEFLAAAPSLPVGCLIVDIRMPEMDGLELQQHLTDRSLDFPLIVITGHGDVPLAVRAMKAGAVDFIEKPFEDDLLLTTIEIALATAAGQASRERTIGDAAALIATLSPRERQVLEGIVAGRSTKMIAHYIGISPRTVEVHRAHMLERLGIRSIAEAIRLAVMAGLGSAVR